MRNFFFVLSIAVMVWGCKSQAPTAASLRESTIYGSSEVDKGPEPEGGFENLYKALYKKVKYPREALKNGVEGIVYVNFVVDESGQLSEFGIEQGLGYGLDDAAIEGFKKTNSRWIAARKDGKKVKVKMVMPVAFKLN